MNRALPWFGYVGGALGLLAIASPAAAQSQGPDPLFPAPQPQAKMIGGAPTTNIERCVDVQIGNETAFGCLNQKLRREVDKINPSLNLPPVDARSSDVRVGNVNEAAVRQQYGASYGRSAIPFRPSAVVPPHR